jgi:hypothetical protein
VRAEGGISGADREWETGRRGKEEGRG